MFIASAPGKTFDRFNSEPLSFGIDKIFFTLVQVSISSTFYVRLLHMKANCAALSS